MPEVEPLHSISGCNVFLGTYTSCGGRTAFVIGGGGGGGLRQSRGGVECVMAVEAVAWCGAGSYSCGACCSERVSVWRCF